MSKVEMTTFQLFDLNVCYMVLILALRSFNALLSGAVYRCMQPVDDSSSVSEGDGIKWAAVSDRLLVPLLDQLFYHIARLVNIQTMLKLVYIYILEFKKTLILR